MTLDELPVIVLPTDLDDAAASQLLECLYEAARVLENHYAAQLRRHHYADNDERQHVLWPHNDPPF